MGLLEGKVAIITGAGRGLGRMTFEQICADAGVNVETAKAILRERGIEVLEVANGEWRSTHEYAGPEPRELAFVPLSSGGFRLVHSNVNRWGRPSSYFSWFEVPGQ